MSTLKSYLTTIADAIREKKGTTEPINAKNFASEILSIQGGGSLNVAYGLTPPTDTSKIWLQCAEPSGIEVQNYLGECAVSNVANYGAITNPVSDNSYFRNGDYGICYIGNNQIAIVGTQHIRIYNLASKSYILDYYTTGVGAWYKYTNVLYKDNVLYYGNDNGLYSFDLNTQTHTTLANLTNYTIYHIFFNSDNEIDCLIYYNSKNYRYRYDLTTNTYTKIASISKTYGQFQYLGHYYNGGTVKIGNYIYNFNYLSSYSHYMRYDLSSNVIEEFTSLINFCTSLSSTGDFRYSTAIYDNERYVYLIGGGNSTIGFNNIIKYDVLNDSFELLDNKLLSGKFVHLSVLVDNRVYIFGGETSGTNYGRTNQIDYFDLSYPLTQNNAILTINNKTDKYLPLINTEKLKLNSNIASAYLGNANNLAEKVNAYYHNGYGWVGINCEDYTEPESGGTGGGLSGGGDVTTDPEIPVDKPVEI